MNNHDTKKTIRVYEAWQAIETLAKYVHDGPAVRLSTAYVVPDGTVYSIRVWPESPTDEDEEATKKKER